MKKLLLLLFLPLLMGATGNFNISWNPVPGKVSYYKIICNNKLLTVTTKNAITYRIVLPGNTRNGTIKVIAVNKDKESLPSDPAKFYIKTYKLP